MAVERLNFTERENMDKEEIIKEMEMDYDQLVRHLLNKYGGAKCDYFTKTNCKNRSKLISRTNEGLICHHIDEDKAYNLSVSERALDYPFDYQKKERLIYCNYIEHLLLHIVIAKDRYWKENDDICRPNQFTDFVDLGVQRICNDINMMYEQEGTEVKWINRCYREIDNNFTDYVYVLQSLIKYVLEHYTGEKPGVSLIGKKVKVRFKNFGEGEILKVDGDEKNSFVTIKFEHSIKRLPRILVESNSIYYHDCLDFMKRRVSGTYNDKLIDSVYDLLNIE